MFSDIDMTLLKQRLKEAGCLKRRPLVVMCELTAFLLIAAASVYLIFFMGLPIIVDVILAIIANVFLIAIRFIGHEATHNAIFNKPRVNLIAEFLIRGVIHGESVINWRQRHAIHHKFPRIMDVDTGVYINESVKQHSCRKHHALLYGMRSIYRYLSKPYFYPIMIVFWYPYYRFVSLVFLAKACFSRRCSLAIIADLICVLSHYLLWAMIFYYSGFSAVASLFIYIAFWSISGAWIIGIGAVAHENISAIDVEGEKLEPFLEKYFSLLQFIAAQNIKSNRVSRWVYVGLDYHIEHHLFPYVSHLYLPRASLIVKQYADETGLPYLEFGLFEGMLQAYKQMQSTPVSIKKALQQQLLKMKASSKS